MLALVGFHGLCIVVVCYMDENNSRTAPTQRHGAELIKICNTKCERQGIPNGLIGNMDKTAIWADMPTNSTVDVRGSTSVLILTTGHEKQRITVCLAAMADGSNLLPFVVLKGKRLPKNLENLPNVIVHVSRNAWMNEEHTSRWIAEVWGGTPLPSKRMLVWDLFKCHFTDAAKTQLQESKSIVVAIPPGCTKIVQPAIVCWNARSKHSIATFTITGWKKANMI